MGKYNDLYGLLGNYHVLMHSNPEKAAQCRRGQIEDFIYESNALGNVQLSKEEVHEILANGVTSVTEQNHDQLLTVGLFEAFKYVDRLVADRVELNQAIVKELHSILYTGASEEFRGQYRTDYVTIPHAQNLPPVRHISYFMNKLFDEFKEANSMDIIERIAWFHVKFEGIHPFEAGNGQVGRLILNYHLMRSGYPFIIIKKVDQKRYFKALEIYQTQVDLQPMKELILDSLVDQLSKRITLLSPVK